MQAQEREREALDRSSALADQEAQRLARAEIATPFAGAYEDLRRDFKATVGALAAPLREVSDNAESIKNGAHDISSTADGLSRRTEKPPLPCSRPRSQ